MFTFFARILYAVKLATAICQRSPHGKGWKRNETALHLSRPGALPHWRRAASTPHHYRRRIQF
jgi:hypothetical protein